MMPSQDECRPRRIVLTSKTSVPQAAAKNGSVLLRFLRRMATAVRPILTDYRRLDGYEGLRKAFDLGPEGTLRELIASKLLGRGGAAFPRQRNGKRSSCSVICLQEIQSARTTSICNADESEPGTFKDRILMEGDPFAVLEGMTIARFRHRRERRVISICAANIRSPPNACNTPLTSADENGFLGDNILGSGLNFNIEIRRGAGAYICGEETALFNSIEGYRGEPRNKPPFPTQAGLFRQPTVVNNVETLINVPGIILEGGAAYARLGTESSAGTRLFCLCGHVARPGVYEIAMGTTLRQLIELAGGVAGSGKLQAILLGGAAGTFVSPKEFDTPLTFEGTRAIGATLGSGVVMLFDDTR